MQNPVENAARLEKAQHETLSSLQNIKASLETVTKPPAPWEAHFSEKYKRIYYYNTVTKESIWEPPPGDSDTSRKATGGPAGSPDGSASATSQSTRVEDSLMQRGLSYMKKREDLKKKHDDEIMAEMTGKPQLSKYANERVPARDASTESIADRAALALKAKKEKEEMMRRQLKEREQNELQAVPVITKKSQKLTRNVDDMISWEEQRRARIEARQAAQEQQQEQQFTPGPVIATSKAVNEKLLKKRQIKFGDMPIEERLQQCEEIRQFKLQKAAEKADKDARLAARPHLVTRPAAIAKREETAGKRPQSSGHPQYEGGSYNREDDEAYIEEEEEEEWSDEEEYNLYIENMTKLKQLEVDDSQYKSRASSPSMSRQRECASRGPSEAELSAARMYHQAELHQRQRAAEMMHRTAMDAAYGPDGKPLFQPRINPTSAKMAVKGRGQHIPVEELLARKGQEREERMKKRQEKQLKEQKEQSNPKINPTSERIVREKELMEGPNKLDRLSKPIGTVKQNILDGIEKPTFVPKISKKSAQLATQGHYYSGGGSQQGARSGSNQKARPSAMTAVDANSGNGIANIRSSYSHSNSDIDTANGFDSQYFNLEPSFQDPVDEMEFEQPRPSTSAVYDRANHWARERELARERDRKERDREEMRNCTFQPRIQSAPPQDGLVRGRGRSRERSASRGRSGSAQSGRDCYESGSESEYRRMDYNNDMSARQSSWARKRDQKLAIERKHRDQEALDACTFAPDLSHRQYKGTKKGDKHPTAPPHNPSQHQHVHQPLKYTDQPLHHIVGQSKGSFSYDTPYVDQTDDYIHADLGGGYVHDTGSAATRLDFGADDDDILRHQGNSRDSYYTYNSEVGGGSHASTYNNNNREMSSSAPTNAHMVSASYISDHRDRSMGDGDEGAFDDGDEYGAEFELDESGAIVNVYNDSRY